MAKDPAFLFYPSDFLSGVVFLSDDQIGKYIKLLCLQHLSGRMKEKDMLKITKAYDEEIFSKFLKDDKGLYYNERLEIEMGKRKNYSESRRKNRAQKKDMSNICETHVEDMLRLSSDYVNAMSPHMENVNENENIIKEETGSEDEIIEPPPQNNFLVQPFESKEFVELWANWKVYKKEQHQFTYKSLHTEQAALKEIAELSSYNEEKAIKIIHKSISKGWKGFFKLDENESGTTTNGTGNRPATGGNVSASSAFKTIDALYSEDGG